MKPFAICIPCRRPRGRVLILIALGLGISVGPMQGQTISFLRQFSTPEINQASAVAADASGIYVTGNRGVHKYDSRGNELWTREYSVPALEGARLVKAAPNATGVYVVGWSTGETNRFVRKYGPGGDELWTRQLDFLPTGLGVDDTGVYVAGGILAPFPDRGNLLRKYDAEGAELWTSRFQDSEPRSPYYGVVAVDATGVYVFYASGVSNISFSFAVSKWDPRGNELWTRQLDTPAEYLLVAAADPTGFFVVGAGSSPFLRKYDAEANELWTRRLASGIYPGGVAADATGVYVAGTTDLAGPALPRQCRSGSGVDSFVRRYDPDGTELWTREFSASDAAWARGVAVDASSVHVVGSFGEAFYSTALPAGGAFLAKFEKSAAAVASSGPRIFPDCVVNAASYVGGGVAPGEIVTFFGSAIGPPELVQWRLSDDGRVATTLAETRILFNGIPTPLLYVSDKQSSAIVPYSVADRTSVEAQVEYRGVRSDPVTVPVLASRPGIFSLDGSGRGQGAILNEDGSLNSPSNPARRGSTISIFGTGGGEAAPGLVDGQIVSGVLPRTSLPVSVFFDVDLGEDDYGESLVKLGEVMYAGGSPGSVAGLLQVDVRVPANAAAREAAPLALTIGSRWTVFQVTVALD